LERRPDLGTWLKSRASFEYADLLIKRLRAGVWAFGLENSTEIMVSVDHLVWNEPRWYEHARERPLLTGFANQKLGSIPNGTTWDNVAPTLFEIVGIGEYDPLFPFNEEIFSELVDEEPSDWYRVCIQNMVQARG
jgi:hypothetical protein